MTSKSPDRNTFQAQSTLKQLEKDPSDEAAKGMLEWYAQLKIDAANREEDPEWKKDNMEYDLRTSDWMLEKVRGDDIYAQHLYASMCNVDFTKNAVWPLLQGRRWNCSWRHAGGIVADMQQHGDYIDWYCSGMRGEDIDETEFNALSKERQEQYLKNRAFVGEGMVTEEIRADLFKLGWIVHDDYSDEDS